LLEETGEATVKQLMSKLEEDESRPTYAIRSTIDKALSKLEQRGEVNRIETSGAFQPDTWKVCQ